MPIGDDGDIVLCQSLMGIHSAKHPTVQYMNTCSDGVGQWLEVTS